MLNSKEGNCVKKKRRKSAYKKKAKRKIHSFQMILGVLFTFAAVMFVAGISLFSSRAMDELKFVTNSGYRINEQGSSWKMMDGAVIYIEGISQGSEVYYKFYEKELSDTSGLVLKTPGAATKYNEGDRIELHKPVTQEGISYLYVQQFEGENKRLDCYKISYYEKAQEVTVLPETSDTQMTSLKAGDILRFIGEGTLYYTTDGSAPSFTRAQKDGTQKDFEFNGEAFLKDHENIQVFGTGNMLEIPASWISQETLTIRVVSAAEESDFSPVATFRFILTQDQAQVPQIAPETTAESPVIVPDGTTAALTSQTEGGTVLYTLNGKVPAYEVKADAQTNGAPYTLEPGADTEVYTDRITVTGKPGTDFVITAITIKYTEEDGIIMKDSDPIQFVYRFASLGIASVPDCSPEAGSELSVGDSIYLSSVTTGSKILYTLDGTSPAYSYDEQEKKIVLAQGTYCYGESAPYIIADEAAGAVAGGSFLIQAKTVAIDEATGEKLLEDSPVIQFSFTLKDLDTVAAPTVTPATKQEAPTVVKEGDKILLSTTTAGASIYYTLDGSAPALDESGKPKNEATKLYEGQKAIQVPKGTGYLTITALAVKENMNDSQIIQFQFQYPQIVAPPYCTPAEGTVSVNTEVELASLDKDALIYYTLDGTEPTAVKGKIYSDPILLTSSVKIKAISIVNGISSIVRTFEFNVSPVLQPPSSSIASGAVVTPGTTVKLYAQNGAEILYTTDGSDPKEGAALSGSTAIINGKPGDVVTLITYAKGADYSDSQTATYIYTISNYENGILASPESGTSVKPGDIIQLDTDVTNPVIYYEIGGATPTTASTTGNLVTVPVSSADDTFILKAMVVPAGSVFNNLAGSFQYPYLAELAAPKASIPDLAVLMAPQKVELTAEEGDIYYTVDSVWPDEYANIYTDEIYVDKQLTILAFAMNEEGERSKVVSFTYTFASQVSPPQFSVNGGEVETGTTLTLRSDTPGATVYYTLDGQTPDPENPGNLYTYSGAIRITEPVHIKAIAVKDRMTDSAVTYATFTVKEVQPEIIPEEETEERKELDGSRLMSRRSYMDSGSGPSYSDFVLKSALTGVIVSAPEGVLPLDLEIQVTQTPVSEAMNKSVYESAGKNYAAIAGYEVRMLQNGTAIQLENEVEVGFPIPENARNSAISIAGMDEEGNVMLYDTRRDNDMAYAFTDHIGQYCIVGLKEAEAKEESSHYSIWLAITTAVLLAVGYLLIRMAGKKGEADE